MEKNKLIHIFAAWSILTTLTPLMSDLLAEDNKVTTKKHVVIVNPVNDYKEGEDRLKNMIKSLFLKKRSAWPNDLLAKSFAQKNDSEIHKAFVDHILELTQGQLDEHWISLKSKKGIKKQREVSSILMIRLVSKYEGAFGYVFKEEAELNKDKVSILFEF